MLAFPVWGLSICSGALGFYSRAARKISRFLVLVFLQAPGTCAFPGEIFQKHRHRWLTQVEIWGVTSLHLVSTNNNKVTALQCSWLNHQLTSAFNQLFVFLFCFYCFLLCLVFCWFFVLFLFVYFDEVYYVTSAAGVIINVAQAGFESETIPCLPLMKARNTDLCSIHFIF